MKKYLFEYVGYISFGLVFGLSVFIICTLSIWLLPNNNHDGLTLIYLLLSKGPLSVIELLAIQGIALFFSIKLFVWYMKNYKSEKVKFSFFEGPMQSFVDWKFWTIFLCPNIIIGVMGSFIFSLIVVEMVFIITFAITFIIWAIGTVIKYW